MKTQKSIKSNKAGDLVVDVVVIGGGAGLAAAIAAAENGMKASRRGQPWASRRGHPLKGQMIIKEKRDADKK